MNQLEKKEEKRLGVDLPRDLIVELHNYVPWGQKKYLYEALTEQLIDLLERSDEPQVVIAMIVQGEIRIEEILDNETT